MRLSRILLALLFAVCLAAAHGPLVAHGGGLDRCGGHNDRKHGGYHVHNQAQYCVCYPESAGCGGEKAPAKPRTPRPAGPGQTQGLVGVPDGEATTATVYVTGSGTKYHRKGCQYLTTTARATTLAKAAKSKSPCKVCRPPTLAPPALGSLGTLAAPKATAGGDAATPRSTVTTRCAATTQKGTRCKRTAQAGSFYCSQHSR